ncbi:MAG TPA: hypothetical protein VK590_06145 [Saprospiraceae bacterium]|nr:hypothetical protein [Saprospiraceae bacterium]
MNAIQLEFKFDDNSVDDPLLHLHKRLDDMNASNTKVRKRLFMELGILKKLCYTLKHEVECLQDIIKDIKNEKTKWAYAQGDYLFNVQEP